jgi:hypothetical protein
LTSRRLIAFVVASTLFCQKMIISNGIRCLPGICAALAALVEARGQRANELLPAKGSRVQAFAREFRL